ncbi:LacI family transcriptional regulator [Rhodobacterales bacterium 52_120_T64]|nr:LacI family transcriptional regulator [Rhodobacterales bacterium 52_120_T64]
MNLKELAGILGLSQTTVSRALNGYPEVREATRKRVMEAANIHNYKPDMRAKGLATGRSMAIGHVVPLSTQHEMVNPVFADFIAGAGEIYSDNGYDILLSVVADVDEENAYRKFRSGRSVDGVIIHGPHAEDPRIALLTELNIPFVVHGRAGDNEDRYNWVDVNNRHSFLRATEFLLDLGHKRIGLLNGLESMDFARRRREGYAAALLARDIPIDPDLMAAGEMTEELGFRNAKRMLAESAPPTAFLVSSMSMAIGARRAISDAGKTLGRDVSVVIHDDDLSYLKNGSNIPIFTAARSPVRQAGRLCAEMLLEIIANPDTEYRNVLLESELMVGMSTGPAPKQD